MTKKSVAFFYAVIAVLLKCASQGYPPGGPEDRTAPFIVHTHPARDTTNVPVDIKPTIIFSEPVNPTSCQEALFITPFPGENIRYKWKRDKELTIIFGEALLENRTYVFTIGAGTKDRRNNAMQSSFTLAFSTGDVLDKARIQGFVYGDRVEGTQIWAYDLADTTTADPSTFFPLYITQVGTNGAYQLTNMALGNYRLFAVLDRDVNNRYNVEYDMLGVGSRDVLLDSSSFDIDNFNFRTTLQDTTPPRVIAAIAPDWHHVDLRFSESMLPDCLATVSNYSIVSENNSLEILNASHDFYNAAVVHLATAKQDSNSEYHLFVKEAYDLSYLPMLADSNAASFIGSAVPDTAKPAYLTMQPRDSSKFVLSFTPLHFYFSEAIKPETIQSHLVVADTLGDTIKGTITWPEKSHFIYTPTQQFAAERFYLTTLPVDSVFDLTGNPLADTLFQRQFTSINPDTLTAISGTVRDADTTASGPFFLRARSTDEKNSNNYNIWLDQPGLYAIKNMLPGSYIIELYRDEDNNGRFSYGSAFPFSPAERFWVYADTITVRARWPNDGEDLMLPE
ncbi:hypothetical protein EH223_18015 [candidate division KSB1 bacterium]|nr:Ig-like domain-containing protein [candidate division KSB1 bacterium]RQW00645.1 MAG: hypothetical protein EH223_18015 [candidate division KSB1 bacterium]